eukprot:4509727-Alexandrium_andersonii.AAC.1
MAQSFCAMMPASRTDAGRRRLAPRWNGLPAHPCPRRRREGRQGGCGSARAPATAWPSWPRRSRE